MQLVELRLGIDLETFLREQYVEKRRLVTDIATELDVDKGTVSRWKDHFGLERAKGEAA